jgi:hypothetical protein
MELHHLYAAIPDDHDNGEHFVGTFRIKPANPGDLPNETEIQADPTKIPHHSVISQPDSARSFHNPPKSKKSNS